MKQFIVVLLAFASIHCASNKKTNATNHLLNGSWLPVKQEFGGAALPSKFFEKQQLIISDSNYTVIAESVDKGVIQYSNGKMDIYGKEGVNTGKHFTAIYTLEKGLLTICYNLAGNGYPETFDTKGKPKYFLSVFKK